MQENYTSQALDIEQPVYSDSSKGKRFGGFLIDYVARIAITFVIVLIFPIAATNDDTITFGFNTSLAEIALDYFIVVLYYWILEATTQQTIGKMILGMRIIKEDGSAPTALNVLGRSFCRLIPFDALSLLIGDRAWHDSIPGIRVVDK
ncbi:MAG: RDD family protein [Flavobacteriales bacterium]|nr:RDD family protein [Flavobacteriales bacterium]